MNISEAAKLVGLSTKQIRDYEKMGLIKPAVRSLSGYRNYGESDCILFATHAMWDFRYIKSHNY